MPDAYAVDKLAAHPETLRKLRETGEGDLLSVHLMPTNRCGHGCAWCSYRMDGNKNSSAFDESKQIPWGAMLSLLDDFETLGVKGVEVTGGGEPLSYRWVTPLWHELARRPFATALVTNGTLLTDELARLITSSHLRWARVSIDSSNPGTYSEARRVKPLEYDRAWNAVELLRKHAPKDPEFRLGVGFVQSNENMGEVHEFVRMAKERGADNVRLSVTFSDHGPNYYKDQEALRRAVEDSKRADADFTGDSFAVNNLIPARVWEVSHPAQDYKRCPTKDVLCVVEGECKVYTCCTFTGSPSGLYGKFTEHAEGFLGLWRGQREWRKKFNASEYCKVSCLYRDRNIAMNKLIDAPEHVHREFI